MLTNTDRLADRMVDALIPRAREALIRGTIWAFVGLLYATLFISFAVFAETWALPINPYFFAGIMAGSLSALMYSSMRLVVFIALLLFPFSMVYFFSLESESSFAEQLQVMIPAGLIIGAAYGQFSKRSRVGHADAKTLAGLSAGFLVALTYLLIDGLVEDIQLALLIGMMTPLTGALYISLMPVYMRLYNDLLPSAGGGALVGASVATFISLSLLLMDGSITLHGEDMPAVRSILEMLPHAALGGVAGAGLAGILSGLLLTKWRDY